jgi:hypothetical protein
VLAFGFGQQVEVNIVLLVKVFVLMSTKLGMKEGLILPLHMGLDCKQLHKVVDFIFVKA